MKCSIFTMNNKERECRGGGSVYLGHVKGAYRWGGLVDARIVIGLGFVGLCWVKFFGGNLLVLM